MNYRQIAVRLFRPVLGLFFVADGIIKLTGISQTIEMFDRIGWGQWFRYFTGGVVLLGGLGILVRLRWTFYSAVACAATVGAGALFYVFTLHHDPTLPAVITALTIVLAVLTYAERGVTAGPPAAAGSGTLPGSGI